MRQPAVPEYGGGPPRLQRFFERHPRSAAAVCSIGLGYGAARCTIALWHAGSTVGSGYGLAVTIGLICPLAILGLVLCFRRHGGVLRWGLLGLCGLWFICLIESGPAVFGQAGFRPQVITSPVQAGALALITPGWAVLTVLAGLIVFRPPDSSSRGWQDPGTGTQHGLITGLAGPRKSGWSVTWVCDGPAPDRIHAPSLSAAAETASAAVADLFSSAAGPATEFQLAIYPWRYHDGPVFDITGAPGGFTAQDGAASVYGATLEDLLAAAQRMPAAHGAMFRWTRPVSALSPADPG
jgi:hypothetical protein